VCAVVEHQVTRLQKEVVFSTLIDVSSLLFLSPPPDFYCDEGGSIDDRVQQLRFNKTDYEVGSYF
jgi:hypothetical protein